MNAASLILFLVWAHGRLYYDNINWSETRSDGAGEIVQVVRYSASASGGRLVLSRTVYNEPVMTGGNPYFTEWPLQDRPPFGWRSDRLPFTPSWTPAGFAFKTRVRDYGTFHLVAIPFWAVVLEPRVVPALWFATCTG